MPEPLSERRDLLRRQVLPNLSGPIRDSEQLNASLPNLIAVMRSHGL